MRTGVWPLTAAGQQRSGGDMFLQVALPHSRMLPRLFKQREVVDRPGSRAAMVDVADSCGASGRPSLQSG